MPDLTPTAIPDVIPAALAPGAIVSQGQPPDGVTYFRVHTIEAALGGPVTRTAEARWEDGPTDFAAQLVVEPVEDVDDWGRPTGQASSFKVVSVKDVQARLDPLRVPLPPMPDRPEHAIDSTVWENPDKIVVTRWQLVDPMSFDPGRLRDAVGAHEAETRRRLFGEWRQKVDTHRFNGGSGDWAAVYWQNGLGLAERFDTTAEASEWLNAASEDGLLAAVGVVQFAGGAS